MTHRTELSQRTDVPLSPPGLTRSEVVESMYRTHYWSLVGLVRLLVDDKTEAEDIVQEGLAKLYASFRRLNDEERALPYLRSIVLNHARDRLRRRRTVRASEHLLDAPDCATPPSQLSRPDRDRVVAAIRTLPRRQMECVALRYYNDCSEREIAATLGISAGSVKKHLHRAQTSLTNELEDFR